MRGWQLTCPASHPTLLTPQQVKSFPATPHFPSMPKPKIPLTDDCPDSDVKRH
ncbi:hypothetical protein ASPBRDRAFT_41764 [Aspergillus brasiliensis CBS 101740]|uniref:Uncharacterized protein n=1 Tax=Aspergillus brasiliensis (strain CBS 101740 / IMI 381727 / IBT 21946) TaxID=767769 RepID=A0A1L9UQL9_ASPBC|nr:hypothetical protein ASPBRDRAFT_41764 [Aspergillus brasiliensis CBS 101740]